MFQNGLASIGYKLNSSVKCVLETFQKGMFTSWYGVYVTEQRFQNRLFDIKKKISHYRQLFTVSFAVVFLSNQVSNQSSI